MPDENQHIVALMKLREVLLEQRRESVEGNYIDGFLKAQSAIEAVERAIEHERRISPHGSVTG